MKRGLVELRVDRLKVVDLVCEICDLGLEGGNLVAE